MRLEIRSDDVKGFVVLPRRRVLERTFSWFGRYRRITKDYENLVETLAAFVVLACIQIASGDSRVNSLLSEALTARDLLVPRFARLPHRRFELVDSRIDDP